jgi:hypothetical protein
MKLSAAIALGLLLATCKPVLREPELHAGSLDLSRYMSFGNSFTSAFLDGALSREGQLNAYPNLLAEQFKVIGGGEFLIPLMNSDSGCNWLPSSLDTFDLSQLLGTYSRLELKREARCNGGFRLHPRLAFESGESLFDLQGELSPLYIGGPFYNNLAVPGMRTQDLFTEKYGFFNVFNLDHFNPYFWRFSSDQDNAFVAFDAVRQRPTFFTLWFGINDVLPYALAGGNRSNLKWAAISELNGFEPALRGFLSDITDNGNVEGALATIPDITEFPFFSTINPIGLELTEAEADALDSLYSGYGWMDFSAGSNAFVIVDPDVSIGVRQIGADEKLLLSIDPDSLLCGGWGKTVPIGEDYVLNSVEIQQIRQAILMFNEIIKTLAAEYNLALVDVEGLFERVKETFVDDGVLFSYEWLFSSFFSLDGIHPTPRGQGLIANEFIKAINLRFNAAIPMVTMTGLRGNLFP